MISETWLEVADVSVLSGITRRNVRKAIAGDGPWHGAYLVTRQVEGHAGSPRYQIALSSLPKELQDRWLQGQIERTEIKPLVPLVLDPFASIPAPEPTPPPGDLKTWQRTTMDARLALIRRVEYYALAGAHSINDAVIKTIAEAKAGKLPPDLQRCLSAALGKHRQPIPSERTLYRWFQRSRIGTTAVAPLSQEKARRCPSWGAKFLKLYQKPNKPSIQDAWEALCSVMESPPSYQQCKRLLLNMGTVDKHRGRLGTRELKNIRGYVARDFSDLWPTDVYSGDGHTFDAEVAHPDHGRPFRPEITTIIDVATRRAVGWSAGLSESTWSVMDALRNAVETGGIPAIWYTDRGSGFEADAHTNESTGFLARLGITHKQSLPYNSQSRGVVERAHQTIWVHAARQLPTFIGADMDPQAKQKIFKITRKETKEQGTSNLLMPWRNFLVYCQCAIDAYNDHPHSSLPTLTDPATGQTIHQSPNQAWALATHEGFQPIMLTPVEARDLFRPYKKAKVSRCIVTLHTNSYYHVDLEQYHGDHVLVGYDIHDARQVWVRDLEGRLICEAKWDGNKKAYFPKSVVELAREQREAGRLKRLEVQADEIRAEANPGRVIELNPLSAEDRATAQEELRRLEAQQPPADAPVKASVTHLYIRSENATDEGAATETLAPGDDGRPIFRTDIDYWRWIQDHPDLASADDYAYLKQRQAESSAFRLQVELDLAAPKKNRAAG